MIHNMKLNTEPFNNIENGLKRIELRLFDEKRSKINLGDTIIFTDVLDKNRVLKTTVSGLLRYSTFEDLFKDIDFSLTGPCDSLEEKLNSIYQIYTKESEEKYGVLAISVKVI